MKISSLSFSKLAVNKLFFILVTLLLFAQIRLSAQMLHTDGKRIVNEKGENVLLRGIGLGGWMLQEGYMLRINRESQQYRIRQRIEEFIGKEKTAAFYDQWLANHTRKIDIDSLKAWGFNSVRLPMHYNLYTLSCEEEPVPGKNTWLEKGFAITDSLLAWCKTNRMYLILDLHAAPGGQGNDVNISDRDPSKPSLWQSEANRQKTIALWKKIAERYAGEPWIGGYDLLNEPNWGFEDLARDKNGTRETKNEPLQKLFIDITKAIREVDTKHMVIIEGNGWGNNYKGMEPTWDKNMVLSFHKYWAHNDPGSANHIIKMRDTFNIPAWLGETGENSNVWFTEAIRLFEANNIGWAWWPLKKLGGNNPLEITSNPEYDALAMYLSGRQSQKPSEADALKGLTALTRSLKIENNIVHKDVLDAMFRQPFSAETKPFAPNLIGGNTLLRAADYDLGRNGFAYFDKDTADYHVSTGKNTPGNRGRTYRNDGVDLRRDSTDKTLVNVTDIEDGEWLQYTITIAKSGKYTLKLMVAADHSRGVITVNNGKGKPVAATIAVPNTGGMNAFKELTLKPVAFEKGKQMIRIYAEKGGFALQTLRFTR